jgi:uncharacterized membrane protein
MSEAEVTKNAEDVSHGSRAILLQQTLPYVAVLTLAVVGVAYTNISHQPLTRYWEFLALATGVFCVVTEWDMPRIGQLVFACCGRKRSTGWPSW